MTCFRQNSYNKAGALTQETYPSGRTATASYDATGRAAGLTGYKSNQGNRTYASSIGYARHGAIQSLALGNGRWEHTDFNSRLQPTAIGLGTSSTDSSLLSLSFGYGTTDNNGNVRSQQISVPGVRTWNQSYNYDHLNRIQSIIEDSAWSQGYGYDQYGNRWVTAGSYLPTPGLTPQSQSAFNAANNRLTAGTYDNAGNLLTDALGNTFTYDAENRQKSYNGTTATYTYDGEGHRVRKTTSAGAQTVYVYDAMGRLVTDYSTQAAELTGTRYLTQDPLGSTRVVTNSSGAVHARHDNLPFGEEIGYTQNSRNAVPGYGASDPTRQRFTGKERDNETGLDYFLARYYSGAQGRFLSPDPLEVMSLDEKEVAGFIGDPQNWNQYAYVKNSPLVYIDPAGKIAVLAGTNPNLIELAKLNQECKSAQGWARVWAEIKYAMQESSLLPTPFAISMEGAALAKSGQSLESLAQIFTGLSKNKAHVLENVAEGVAYRIPDLLGESPTLGKILGEVKNVSYLSRSPQLLDAIKAAEQQNSTLYLFI